MELVNAAGQVLYKWDTEAGTPTATITGADLNTVRLHEVSDTVTAGWLPNRYVYSLTVWFAVTGEKRTILRGTFEVKK
jgi:hypothetical protein